VRASQLGWRDFFADPRLEALLTAALERNRDLAMAVARVEEARGLYQIEDAARMPSVAGTADVSRARVGTGSQFGGSDAVFSPTRRDRFAVGVAAPAFELDFWGRVRNQSEAARASYLSTFEAQRAFQLALVRAVAGTYLTSLEAAERIRFAESVVTSRREGLEIAGTRLTAGLTSELEFRQAESLLTQAETELAALRLTRARTDNALGVLIGGPLSNDLPPPLPLGQQTRVERLVEGLPSDLLVARPDIAEAEERLHAARASVGAARAAFFPSIVLTGNAGYASLSLDDLVGSDGMAWTFGPSLNLPIFNRGRLRGNETVAEAREDMAVATYERTVQTAFQEVSDVLAGRRYLAEQVEAQERGTLAQRQIAELARMRYKEGVVAYLEVLDAERNLFASEQALLSLRRAQAENLVALYVALGGGTRASADP
jgi:outer membrane protein, multidrug efflux system